MSTQNFVSYGDAETLMSGIKSAIDGASGGGGSFETVVASYTAQSGQNISQCLTELGKLVPNNLTQDIAAKLKLRHVNDNAYGGKDMSYAVCVGYRQLSTTPGLAFIGSYGSGMHLQEILIEPSSTQVVQLNANQSLSNNPGTGTFEIYYD